jgi:hypothetical protein
MEKEETTGRQGHRPDGEAWATPSSTLFQVKNTMSMLPHFAVLCLGYGSENSSKEFRTSLIGEANRKGMLGVRFVADVGRNLFLSGDNIYR